MSEWKCYSNFDPFKYGINQYMTVGIYARVSTTEQENRGTIQSQLLEIREFCVNRGYEMAGEYIDDGYSGSILERPSLDRLRDDAKAHKFEAIVLHHPDRLSRSQLHQMLLYDEFERQKIKLHFVRLPDFSEGGEESRVVNKSVWSMVAELERLRIRERTRRGRKNKAKKGQVVGNLSPYGYKYVKDLHTYEIIPAEVETVKNIFNWVAGGMSARQVVKKLNELKVPTVMGSDRWGRSSVHKILKREEYFSGITYYWKNEAVEPKQKAKVADYRRTQRSSRVLRDKTEWIPIQLPPECKIITEELFNKVQKQMVSNRRFSTRHTKSEYLLRGLIKCGECGSLYYADSSHGKRIYQCGDKSAGQSCMAGSVSADLIEGFVEKKALADLLDPVLVAQQAARYDETIRTGKNIQRSAVEKKLGDLASEERRIILAYSKGVINLNGLEIAMRDLKFQRTLNERLLDELPAEPLKVSLVEIEELCNRLKKLLNTLDFTEKQFILRQLISEIVYDSKTRALDITASLVPQEQLLASKSSLPTTQ